MVRSALYDKVRAAFILLVKSLASYFIMERYGEDSWCLLKPGRPFLLSEKNHQSRKRHRNLGHKKKIFSGRLLLVTKEADIFILVHPWSH